MPTKHEGKCCEKCKYNHDGTLLGSNWCKNPACPCHTAVDGAELGKVLDKYEHALDKIDGAGIDALVRDLTQVHAPAKSYARKILTEYLSRLHSQILEEVERKAKPYYFADSGSEVMAVPADKIKEIVNHAFKDL